MLSWFLYSSPVEVASHLFVKEICVREAVFMSIPRLFQGAYRLCAKIIY